MASSADRGWVSLATSVPVFLVLAMSRVAGRMADNYGARRILVGGGAVAATSLVGGAFVHAEVIALVLVGVPLGIGMSGLFVPSLRQVEARTPRGARARSIGVAAAGTSVGTLILPPTVLANARGAGLTAVFSGLAIVTAIGAAFAAFSAGAPHKRPQVPARRASVSRRLSLIGLLAGMAYYMPLAHLAAAAEDAGLSGKGAALALGIMGASNLAGRLGVGRMYRPDLGHMWLAFATSGLGVSILFFSPGDPAPIHVFSAAVVYGVASGALVVCLPTAALEQSGACSPGAVIGAIYRSLSVGAVAGPVLAGWWFDGHGTYSAAAVVIGSCALVATLLALSRSPARHAVEASSTS